VDLSLRTGLLEGAKEGTGSGQPKRTRGRYGCMTPNFFESTGHLFSTERGIESGKKREQKGEGEERIGLSVTRLGPD